MSALFHSIVRGPGASQQKAQDWAATPARDRKHMAIFCYEMVPSTLSHYFYRPGLPSYSSAVGCSGSGSTPSTAASPAQPRTSCRKVIHRTWCENSPSTDLQTLSITLLNEPMRLLSRCFPNRRQLGRLLLSPTLHTSPCSADGAATRDCAPGSATVGLFLLEADERGRALGVGFGVHHRGAR